MYDVSLYMEDLRKKLAMTPEVFERMKAEYVGQCIPVRKSEIDPEACLRNGYKSIAEYSY